MLIFPAEALPPGLVGVLDLELLDGPDGFGLLIPRELLDPVIEADDGSVVLGIAVDPFLARSKRSMWSCCVKTV